MGSEAGYGYRYEFLTVHEDEIKSKHKSNRKPGSRGFLFEFRTNFVLVLKATTREEEGEEKVLDSETFDGYVETTKDYLSLFCTIFYRLDDYWMTLGEMKSLVDEALAFANEPKHAHLNFVPVVVRLDVCTVQQTGEPYNAALERAITAQMLVPSYLWPDPTIVVVPKPMSVSVLNFLLSLERIRVEDVDKAVMMMRECGVCKKGPVFGAQISVLGSCNHAFHSKCIVRWLEDTNLCPLCNVPAYEESMAVRPPFKVPQDLLFV